MSENSAVFAGQRILAVIPARAGSKRLPGKNIRPFAGRPLLEWSVRAARESAVFQAILVSSDDERVLDLARAAGAEGLLRPPELATDQADSMSVARHALASVSDPMNIVVLLQPTSPLRREEDIVGSLRCMEKSNAPSVVSVCHTPKRADWTCWLGLDDRLYPSSTGREGEREVGINGAVYAARADVLAQQDSFLGAGAVGFLMSDERSADIDELDEFEEAERRFLSRDD